MSRVRQAAAAINDRAVLGPLMERDALTRAELVRLTGLSKSTASETLSRLESAGFVPLWSSKIDRRPDVHIR